VITNSADRRADVHRLLGQMHPTPTPVLRHFNDKFTLTVNQSIQI